MKRLLLLLLLPACAPPCEPEAFRFLVDAPLPFMHWEGDVAPSVTIQRAFEGDTCLVELAPADDWASASLDQKRRELHVELDQTALVSGRHATHIDFLAPDDSRIHRLDIAITVMRPGPRKKVLFLGIDGLRGDGIPSAHTPSIDWLLRHGASTWEASTQRFAPTVSGPGWASILTGVDADRHGLLGNEGFDSLDRSYPTFMARAHDAGISTAAAVNWLPVQAFIMESGVVDVSMPGNDATVARDMAVHLRSGDTSLHFVHLDDVDHAGHESGFSPATWQYIEAVETIDTQIGLMIDAVLDRPSLPDEDWLFVLTSDHGGEGTGHGDHTPPHELVPLVVAGASALVGPLPADATHMDAHPTILQFLGLDPDPEGVLDGAAQGLP